MCLRGNACSLGRNFKLSLSRIDDCPCHHQSLGLARVAQVATIPFRFQGVQWLWLTCSRLGLKRNPFGERRNKSRRKRGFLPPFLEQLKKRLRKYECLFFYRETYIILSLKSVEPFRKSSVLVNIASAVPLSFRVLVASKDGAAASELLESISRADAAGDHGRVT